MALFEDYFFRIALVGPPKCGKSILVKQYISNDTITFSSTSYVPTIACDFSKKTINLDGKMLGIQIWDTSGLRRMRSFTKYSYRISDGLIVVYDVCNADSFVHLPVYLEYAKSYAREDIKIILIGTENGLKNEREVSCDRAKAWADEVNVPYYEVNVSDHLRVEYLFITLTSMILKDRFGLEENLKLSNSEQRKSITTSTPPRHKCFLI